MQNDLIPDHVVVEILLKLPAKSIGQCRCVSKRWRCLLSDPHFIRSHIDRTKKSQPPSLIFLSHSGYAYSLTMTNGETYRSPEKLSFPGSRRSWARVLASCDGLVFLEDKERKNFLVNPFTREKRKVQPSPSDEISDCSVTVYGLGYDSANLDYKIVSLSYYYSTGVSFSVYSLKRGTWTKAETLTFDRDIVYITPGVFVDGCIHWIVSESVTETTSYSCFITSFCLEQGEFDQIPCPVATRFFSLHYLVEVGGCLCFCSTGDNDTTQVWMMNEYGNNKSWTEFTITGHKFRKFSLLYMVDQEQVVLATDKDLVEYHLEEGTYKNIEIQSSSNDLCIERTWACIESFISPNLSF